MAGEASTPLGGSSTTTSTTIPLTNGASTSGFKMIRPWSEVLKYKPAAAGRINLEFEEPKFVDGVLQIEDELLEEGELDWKDAVVGFFLESRHPFAIVKFHTLKKWKPLDSIKIAQDGEKFYFHFTNTEDKRRALEIGAFEMKGKIFIIKEWSRDLEEGDNQVKKVPIWVKMSNIHKRLWSPRGIARIASVIGEPKFLDRRTEEKEYLTYARVCVEIEAKKELSESFPVRTGPNKQGLIQCEYEWKPYICVDCQCFGHTTLGCPKKMKEAVRPTLKVPKMKGIHERNGGGDGYNNTREWNNGKNRFGGNYRVLRNNRNDHENQRLQRKEVTQVIDLSNSFNALQEDKEVEQVGGIDLQARLENDPEQLEEGEIRNNLENIEDNIETSNSEHPMVHVEIFEEVVPIVNEHGIEDNASLMDTFVHDTCENQGVIDVARQYNEGNAQEDNSPLEFVEGDVSLCTSERRENEYSRELNELQEESPMNQLLKEIASVNMQLQIGKGGGKKMPQWKAQTNVPRITREDGEPLINLLPKGVKVGKKKR